jgi:hypothetical protein
MRSFTIFADRIDPRRWCRVRIHDTVDDLRRAAHQLRPDTTAAWWDGCYGCFHPTWHYLNPDTGRRRYSPNGYAGLLRLADDHVTAEIVAHELMHAAVQIYRMNVHPDVRLGTNCGGREEHLAYIYGDLFTSFQTQHEQE